MAIEWIYLDKRKASIDALQDYSSMACIIQNHSVETADVKDRMASIPSTLPTGAPRNHNPKAGEARLSAALDEMDILEERYFCALEYMAWFKPAWNSLTEEEQFVLTAFYSEDEPQLEAIGAICDKYQIERTSAYKKKNRALARLAMLLYGK